MRAQTHFRIKSQWLYQVKLDHPQRVVIAAAERNQSQRGHYALDQQHLPHIITALEGKLGQSISDHPCLHLVVYAPPCASAPLHVYNALGVRAASADGQPAVDSFLSPKWGAIVIANPTAAVCGSAGADDDMQQHPVDVHLPTAHVMQTLLYLTRRLIDIGSEAPIAGAQQAPLRTVQPRAFELDAFARSGCVQMIHSTTLTLQSLVQLLDGIGNIVINEEVGRAVHGAFAHVRDAKRLLGENRLAEAVQAARQAFDQSERAFYDPSMLALLYFPDDQKFAIYIPLFLPMMIPVVMSVLELARYWFRKEHDIVEVDEATDENERVGGDKKIE